MKVFSDYSHYYDLLYQNKNYGAEVEYINSLICEYAPKTKTILDLGCGTGRHAKILSKYHYEIHGVDSSEEMLRIANLNQVEKNLEFSQGDVRNVKLNKKFDTILSLFHVMSYQITNKDLIDAFNTVDEHLNDGGVFIFDCWYGPSVLTDLPVVRVKRLENNDINITRIAEPIMHSNENVVDVNYEIIIRDKKLKHDTVLHETHKMRYLFYTELELILEKFNFQILLSEEWLTKKKLGYDTWNATFVIKK